MSQGVPNVLESTVDCGRRLQLTAGDLSELSEFASQYQNLLDGVSRALAQGDQKAAKNRSHRVLKSFAAKVCLVVLTARPKLGALPTTMAEIKAAAATLNPYQPVPEAVVARAQPKVGGGVRVLVSFRGKRRALQMMCAHLLAIWFPEFEFDYLTRGKGGTKAAIERLLEIIEEGKYKYVVVADIANFFRSAIKNKIGRLLPLPERVVDNVLLIQDGVTIVVKPMEDGGVVSQHHLHSAASHLETDEAARRGVPQGSSASGIIMYRAVLGPLLGTLSFADRIVLYGDDLAVPVKDMSEGEAVLKALKALYASSLAGPLTIGRQKISHLSQGVDFLSHRIVRKSMYWGGHLHVHPNGTAFRRMEFKAARVFHMAGGGMPGWKHVILYTKRWIASFPLWKPNYLSKLYVWYTLQAGSWHKAVQSIAQKAAS
jgi:hypothetical protein